MGLVVWAQAASQEGSRDAVLEMPRLQEAHTRDVSRQEVSGLRAYHFRAGGLDATLAHALVAETQVAEGPAPPAGTELEQRSDDALDKDALDTRPAVGDGGILGFIAATFGPDAEAALRIARCESGLRPDAVSYDGSSYGVMQIHAPTWASVFEGFWEHWMEPEWNISRAWDIYVRAGYSFSPWSCW